MANDAYRLQGGNGGIVLTGTDSWVATAANPSLSFIQVIEDAVLDSYSGNLENGDSILTGPTLVAGLGIGGRCTDIALLSGTVIGYY